MRAVALPDAFFAIDGLFETFLTVLDDFGAYPAVIERELERYLPFLTTTKVLMAAVRAGVGREVAHEAIKEHAVAVALAMRESGVPPTTTSSIASPPTIVSRSIAPRSTRRRRAPRRSSAPRRRRSTPSSTRSLTSSPGTPMRPPTAPRRSSDSF